MFLPRINFLNLAVSEIQPGQTISRRPPTRPPAHPDTMGENNTPTALKGCGVKTGVTVDVSAKNALPIFLFGESRGKLRGLVGASRDQLRDLVERTHDWLTG